MESPNKHDILANYLRGSGKALGAGAFFTSLVALLVFVIGSYYGLFRHYETVVKGYYDSLLQSVASYQDTLVKQDTYKIDLKKLALAMRERRGVLAVWCTDRHGRLVFHTDEASMREYESKRLPAEYYENVTHRWTFTSSTPDVYVTTLPDRLSRRISIPLYPFGTGDFDFVLGADVKRFVFLPSSPKRLLLYAAGSVLLAFFLLFVPLLLVIRGRFAGIMSQARYMIGAIELEARKEAAEKGSGAVPEAAEVEAPAGQPEGETAREPGARAEEEGPEETEETEEREAPPREERASPGPGRRKPKQPPAKEAAVDASAVERDIEEKMKMIPTLMLMETKQSVFKRQDVTLPFLEASSAVFHSRGSAGSYLHYCEAPGRRCFTMFSYPERQPEDASTHLAGIGRLVESEVRGPGMSGDIMKSLNAFCAQNGIELDASILLISEGDKRIEYCSAGDAQALYLKRGESEMKSLRLDVPGLGSLSKSEFAKQCSYAEIAFVAGDLFLLMPFNRSSVFLGEESLEDLVKRLTLSRREEGARDLVNEVHSTFDPFRRKDKSIPETGLAVVKFL